MRTSDAIGTDEFDLNSHKCINRQVNCRLKTYNVTRKNTSLEISMEIKFTMKEKLLHQKMYAYGILGITNIYFMCITIYYAKILHENATCAVLETK